VARRLRFSQSGLYGLMVVVRSLGGHSLRGWTGTGTGVGVDRRVKGDALNPVIGQRRGIAVAGRCARCRSRSSLLW